MKAINSHSLILCRFMPRSPTPGVFWAWLAVVALAIPASAGATVLYQNLPDLTANQAGDCLYNTTCGPAKTGDTYAAQEFTLSGAATVTSIGFNSQVFNSTYGTAANYQILTVNGQLPGTVLESGSAAPLSYAAGPTGAYFDTTNYAFDVAPIALGAGSYYIAFQEVTTNFSDFLSLGVASCCDAQSNDGGVTYTAGYPQAQGISSLYPSVAVSVNGTVVTAVPEPAALGMFGLGLLLIGAFMSFRRRRSM